MCRVSPPEHSVYIIFPISFARALKFCGLRGAKDYSARQSESIGKQIKKRINIKVKNAEIKRDKVTEAKGCQGKNYSPRQQLQSSS